jgi:hypothetical protein
MERALQICRGFVPSKLKWFNKAVYWKKTCVDSKSHTPSKSRFPKNAWQR